MTLLQVQVGHQKIPYQMKSSRRVKRMRIVIRTDGAVLVTHPLWQPQVIVRQFVVAHGEWIVQKLQKIHDPSRPRIPAINLQDYQRDREQAHHIILSRVEVLNRLLNLVYKKITIRRQATRWGSCSRTGNLNFSYRLIYLPAQLRDYVVVHELCHLQEFNHSPKFWALVESILPNFRQHRSQLNKYR